MIHLVIYNTLDGSILRCVTCPESMAQEQCSAEESWLVSPPVDDNLFKVDLETLEIVPV